MSRAGHRTSIFPWTCCSSVWCPLSHNPCKNFSAVGDGHNPSTGKFDLRRRSPRDLSLIATYESRTAKSYHGKDV